MAKSEVKKSVGKVAKKAPKAKKALKRMVSEIDAEDASEYAYCFVRKASMTCCNTAWWATTKLRHPCVCAKFLLYFLPCTVPTSLASSPHLYI